MRIGFHLTPFWSPTDRAPTAIIDEAIEVVRAAAGMGFSWVSIGHHQLSHPTVWPHPIAMLGRLAPEAGDMRLKTSMLLLPLLNPVDVAEGVVTLDHITHGRLDVGVAIGYRERELEAAGLARKDRVPKLEESIDVMKRLWRGDEVTFEGAYTKLTTARLGLPPCQRPHPPLEMGAQSLGATRRAARLVDAVFFGPQVAWTDIGRLVAVYRETRAAQAPGSPGTAYASRSLIVGASKEAARAAAVVGVVAADFTSARNESTRWRTSLVSGSAAARDSTAQPASETATAASTTGTSSTAGRFEPRRRRCMVTVGKID